MNLDKISSFFERTSNSISNDNSNSTLLDGMSLSVQRAILSNDVAAFKKLLIKDEFYLASERTVVRNMVKPLIV